MLTYNYELRQSKRTGCKHRTDTRAIELTTPNTVGPMPTVVNYSGRLAGCCSCVMVQRERRVMRPRSSDVPDPA